MDMPVSRQSACFCSGFSPCQYVLNEVMHSSLPLGISLGQPLGIGFLHGESLASALNQPTNPMNINKLLETRRKRLLQLIDEYRSQEALAEKLDLTPAYVSHLKNGRKPLSEKAVRKIEEKTNKPSGWMDRLSDDDPRSEIEALLQDISERNPEELDRVLSMLRAYLS